MATMNFSIPDDVKAAFNETFKDENKSAIVADLMRRAVEDRRFAAFAGTEQERDQRFQAALERLRDARRAGRTYSDDEIRALRGDERS